MVHVHQTPPLHSPGGYFNWFLFMVGGNKGCNNPAVGRSVGAAQK